MGVFPRGLVVLWFDRESLVRKVVEDGEVFVRGFDVAFSIWVFILYTHSHGILHVPEFAWCVCVECCSLGRSFPIGFSTF